MPTEPPAAVLSLRLDPANAQVWQGEQLCKLTPKAFAVLHYLVEHHGRLVSKEDLLRAAWPNTVVSEWALTTCLREIRKVLGDQPKAPRWIETVYRRGYRFIGPVITAAPSTTVMTTSSLPLLISSCHPRAPPVGREAELAQLHQWFNQAQGGARQVVFVTGEAGIGKTTLVDAFLEQIAAKGRLWIGRGQCIEHYGTGEAYLPVLEALEH